MPEVGGPEQRHVWAKFGLQVICVCISLFILQLVGWIILGVGANCIHIQDYSLCHNNGVSIFMIVLGIIFEVFPCLGYVCILVILRSIH